MLKKLTKLLMIALMIVTVGTTNVVAEDNNQAYYSATYSFVNEDGDELPLDLVDDLLPFDIHDLVSGDTLHNNDYDPYKSANGSTYVFLGWNIYDYVVANEDIAFVGTWKKEANTPTTAPIVEPTPDGTYKVEYMFILDGTLSEDGLEDILYLKPSDEYLPIGTDPVLPTYDDVNFGFITFKGWDKSQFIYDDGTVRTIYNGIWKPAFTPFVIPGGYPGPEGASKITTGGALGIPGNNCPSFSLNGHTAWCVRHDIPGYAVTGTSYYYGGSLSERVANVMVTCDRRNIDPATTQMVVWWATEGDSRYKAYYDDGIRAWGEWWETYVSATGEMQDVGYYTGWEELNPKLYLDKVCSTPVNYANSCSGTYTLANAKYGVYSDPECTNQINTLTTNASGRTNVIEFNSSWKDKFVYVKELEASEGFKLDDTVYTVGLKTGNNSITSKEDPYDDPTDIVLIKTGSNPDGYNQYLDTAEFTVRYYDTYTAEGVAPTGTPRYTWVFKSEFDDDGVARVHFNRSHYVSGDTTLFHTDGELKIPLGSFTIEETKAPQTYLRDKTIYVGHAVLEDEMVKVTVEGGVNLTVEHEQLEQLEKVGILKTTAKFKEADLYLGIDDLYVADGICHVVDTVQYENLDAETWYSLHGKLVEKIIDRDVKCWTEADVTAGDCTAEDVGKPILWTEEDFTNGLCDEEAVGTERYVTVTVTEGAVITEADTLFKTSKADDEGFVSGTADVEFEINAEDYPDKDFVVYEYLYSFTPDPIVTPGPGTGEEGEGTGTGGETTPEETIPTGTVGDLITYHEDIYDEGQCVHINPLYRAAFVLNKVSNLSKSLKLSGAYFSVTTSRTKRDGTVVTEDLGRFVTGGIYYENDLPFNLEVTNDPTNFGLAADLLPVAETPVFNVYPSTPSTKFGKETATALDLEDGIYLARTDLDPTPKKWYVAKGTIYFEEMIEDTEITFKEEIAPSGYYLPNAPFVMTVGHDYTLDRVEQFRANDAIIINPPTGENAKAIKY